MYLLFFLFWVIFNGQLTLEIAIFGIVISTAMFAFICKFMDYSIEKELRVFRQTGRIFQYIGCLFLEIVKANFATIKLMLSSEYTNDPVIVHFKTNLKTKTARVVLANSITLTPGTITVSLTEDEYVVHCLDRDFADGLEDSVFVKMLTKMEMDGRCK